jgi:hypothetical protein
MPEAAHHIIETNIPIPPKGVGRRHGGIWQNIAEDMQVGDSVSLNSMSQVHGLFIALKKAGKQGTSRRIDAKHYRVWSVKPRKG